MKIRTATASDMPAVLQLIQALADYEREPDAVEITSADLVRDGFEQSPPLFSCLVALEEDVIVGMALYYPRYSTWKGPTIHLEDLIVTESCRGKGYGMELFKQVMQEAAARGVRRVEWAVLDWNAPAISFYEKAGATVFSDWRVVQFSENQLAAFLAN